MMSGDPEVKQRYTWSPCDTISLPDYPDCGRKLVSKTNVFGAVVIQSLLKYVICKQLSKAKFIRDRNTLSIISYSHVREI